jgi:hypothetical protein
MSKTVSDYLGEIRLALGAKSDDTSLFPGEHTLWALNAGLRQITTEREWPWLFTFDADNTSTTAGDDVLALPADHVRTVYLTINDNDLEPASARELAQYRQDSDGYPELYAIEGNNIRLSPPPTGGLTIEHAYFCSEPLLATQQTIEEGGSGLTSFTLTFNGQTTTSIDDDATPAQVEAALVALSTIGVDDVVVTGTSAPVDMTVTFRAALAGTPLLLTATPTGGTGTITIASVDQTLLIPDIYSDWVVAAAAAKLAVRTNNLERLGILKDEYKNWLSVAQDNVRRQGGTPRQRMTRSSVWPDSELIL